MVVRPLVALGFRGAALAWLALSLGSVAVLAWIVTGVFVADPRRRLVRVWPLFAALLLWPPVLHNLEKGQWSVPIAALLALAWASARRARPGRAGALIAAAGCFKITPAIVLVGLLGRLGRWRALAGAAAATLALGIASVVVMGPDYWVDFLRSSGENAAGWQTAPANTMSLWGMTSRLLLGGAFARPALVSPGGARGVWLLGALLLSAAAIVVTWRERPRPTSDAAIEPGVPVRVFAAWSALAVILGPLSWTHTATWLVLPGALLLRDLSRAQSRTAAPAVALLAALVLLTIPRLSLFALAGPLPVAPWRGLLLGVHLLGALLVFAAACLRSPSGRAQAQSAAALADGSSGASSSHVTSAPPSGRASGALRVLGPGQSATGFESKILLVRSSTPSRVLNTTVEKQPA
jgi:hypothetical protein